ncbi:MAG: hypothetical protein ABIM19_08275 [candidate division WOR-3 bacterium]
MEGLLEYPSPLREVLGHSRRYAMVRDADEAMRVYEIYSMRWAVEDYLKFMKECLGSDSFQVRS